MSLHRGGDLGGRLQEQWVKNESVRLGRVDLGVFPSNRDSPGKGLCVRKWWNETG